MKAIFFVKEYILLCKTNQLSSQENIKGFTREVHCYTYGSGKLQCGTYSKKCMHSSCLENFD